jgi:hypothetical protein
VSRYLFLHRIKGPVIILVFGVTALLDTWNILSYGESWPLYLIAIGLLQLAERAAWAQMQAPPPPPAGFPPSQPTGQRGNWGGPAGPSSTSLSIRPPDMPHGMEPESGGRE